ncbi:MAG: hypothetical protein WCI55_09345 [Armatimonadota bacterium]
MVPIIALLVVGVRQDKSDSYFKVLSEYMKQSKDSFSTEKLEQKKFKAKATSATIMDRYSYGAMAVVSLYKGATDTGNIFYARDASSYFKESEFGVSPTYCYVLAKLATYRGQITDIDVKAAKMYYEAKKDGRGCYLLAEILQRHPEARVRSKSLQYALEAQKLLADSYDNRWLVANGYYLKADYTNDKDMWRAAIQGIDKTLELAPTDISKRFLANHRRYLVKRLNGEPTDERRGGVKSSGG